MEPIVVLRSVPQAEQNNAIGGDHVFGDLRFSKQQFNIIVAESDNMNMVIIPGPSVLDVDGIPINEIDYSGAVIPPTNLIEEKDIIIRVSKNEQEIYVYRVKEVLGVQEYDLVNRDKIGNARF